MGYNVFILYGLFLAVGLKSNQQPVGGYPHGKEDWLMGFDEMVGRWILP
jgi:hypothetical protein